ncbi:hypothetical protein [Luteimonas salinilitoris]|uniref:Uncharacterized protein n=1 Tax=Luteimonas salinilitoris TaxID=3237697 RepID=A0ABV4HR96_9GAMM
MFRFALPLAAALTLSLAACTPPEETPPMDEPAEPTEPAGDSGYAPPPTDDTTDPTTDPMQDPSPVDPMDPNAPPPEDPTDEQVPPEDPEDNPPTN